MKIQTELNVVQTFTADSGDRLPISADLRFLASASILATDVWSIWISYLATFKHDHDEIQTKQRTSKLNEFNSLVVPALPLW